MKQHHDLSRLAPGDRVALDRFRQRPVDELSQSELARMNILLGKASIAARPKVKARRRPKRRRAA